MKTVYKTTDVISDFKDFNKAHLFGSVKNLVMIILLPVILIAVGVVQLVFNELFFGIFLLVLSALYVPLILLLNKISVNKHLKSNTLYCEIKETVYTFEDAAVTVESVWANKTEKNIYNYNQMFKGIENKNFFFLYINNMAAVIIRKSGLQEGNTEDVRNALKTQCPNFKSKY